MNDGHGKFTKKDGAVTGIAAGKPEYASWGLASMTDFDNDGIPDVIVDGRNYLHVLRGTGGGAFVYANKTWGGIVDIAEAAVDNGFTFGDIDGDGDLDLIGYKTIDPRYLNVYVNDLPAQSWVNVRPVGLPGNHPAAGAEIRVFAAGTTQLLWFEEISLYNKQVQQTVLRVRRHRAALRPRRAHVGRRHGALSPVEQGRAPRRRGREQHGAHLRGRRGHDRSAAAERRRRGRRGERRCRTRARRRDGGGGAAGAAGSSSGGGGRERARAGHERRRAGASGVAGAGAAGAGRRGARRASRAAAAARARSARRRPDGAGARARARRGAGRRRAAARAREPPRMNGVALARARGRDRLGRRGRCGGAGHATAATRAAGGATRRAPARAGAARRDGGRRGRDRRRGRLGHRRPAAARGRCRGGAFAAGVRVHLHAHLRRAQGDLVRSAGAARRRRRRRARSASRWAARPSPPTSRRSSPSTTPRARPRACAPSSCSSPRRSSRATTPTSTSSWSGPGSAPGVASTPFASADVSADSPEVVTTTVRTITAAGGVNKLVESPRVDQTLFTGKEPRVLATFPDGYLAATGLLGHQVTASALAGGGDFAGLAFLSDSLAKFGASALYAETYALNPDGVVDPVANYEGWLYDRCATFLTFYTHTGDARFLRHAYRSCSYYAGKIGLAGATAGIFTGKPDADPKYSHLRGLYAYYALTGDEGALAAGKAIATMWRDDTLFVGPYRMGHLRGPDKLWTERLLGTSLEGLYYGHRLTGDTTYLAAFKQMLDTAYRHITGDAAALAALNPGVGPFPPQSCFIHSARAARRGRRHRPVVLDLDERAHDRLAPAVPGADGRRARRRDLRAPRALPARRRLAVHDGRRPRRPLPRAQGLLRPEGRGPAPARAHLRLGAHARPGRARNFGASDDDEHCTDATALTAAGIRALVRQGKFATAPAGASLAPFKTRGRLVRGAAPRVRGVRARDVRGRQPAAPRSRGLDERRARRGRRRSRDVHREQPHRLPEVSRRARSASCPGGSTCRCCSSGCSPTRA